MWGFPPGFILGVVLLILLVVLALIGSQRRP
jgi:hypothetical protein